MEKIKILAVQDPAVNVYVDPNYDILKNFPEKDIEVEFNIVPWDKYFDTMIRSFQGEADYDIVMVAGHLWLKDFVEKDYLAEIEYDFEDILPVIANEMTLEGKTYLSPSFCDGHMIAFRKSILKEVLGKLPNQIINTDEFIQIAQELHKAGYKTPIALKASPSEILLDALPYLRSTGKDIYSIEDGNVKCNISEMKNELEKYVSLKTLSPDDTHNYGNDEIKKVLSNKEVIMATTWSGQLGVVMKDCIEKEDVGFMTFDSAWNVTWSFAVNKMSNKKAQCEKFLAYLRSKEVDKLAGEYCGAPVRKSNYTLGMDQFPWYEVQLKMIEQYAKPFESISKSGEKNAVLYDGIYSVFTGKEEISVAIKDAQNKIDSI